MPATRKVELFNGPLDGRLEEFESGLRPEEIGIPDERDPKLYHYYRVRSGKGMFVRSERESGRWSPFPGLN